MFGKKKKEKKEKTPMDKAHRLFQLGAFLVIAFVVYQIYNSDDSIKLAQQEMINQKCETDNSLSEEEIKRRVKEEFDKFIATPHYKKIQDFVTYVESEADKSKGSLLQTADGYLVYMPFSVVKDKEGLKFSADSVDFEISPSIKGKKKKEKADNPESKK